MEQEDLCLSLFSQFFTELDPDGSAEFDLMIWMIIILKRVSIFLLNHYSFCWATNHIGLLFFSYLKDAIKGIISYQT